MLKQSGIKKLVIATMIAGVFGLQTEAAEQIIVSENASRYTVREIEDTFRLFGSIAAGPGGVAGDEFGSDPSGMSYHLGALLSYTTTNMVWDFGLGWFYSTYEGKNWQSASLNIKTRSGAVEISPRLRLSDNWQVGPKGLILFGTDTQQSREITTTNASFLLGGMLAYELVGKSTDARFFGQALTDMDVSDRNVYNFMIGIQLGFGGKTRTIAKEVPIKLVQAAPMPKPEVRITLKNTRVYFYTASHQLRKNASSVLRNIGTYLATNEGNFESVDAFGHTDERGGYEYNLKLSQRRSESVADALARGGARPSKIKTEAFSFARPADPASNKQAWAKNRRVELVFKNVKDPDELIRRINELDEAPDTI